MHHKINLKEKKKNGLLVSKKDEFLKYENKKKTIVSIVFIFIIIQFKINHASKLFIKSQN